MLTAALVLVPWLAIALLAGGLGYLLDLQTLRTIGTVLAMLTLVGLGAAWLLKFLHRDW